MRQRLFARNKSHLADLNLSDSAPHLGKLCPSDVWRNIARKALDNPVSEFGALLRGKLLRLFEDLGNGWRHRIKIQSKPNPGKYAE